MDNEDFLNGGADELQIMLKDLSERDESINKVNACAGEGKRLEKSLQQENDNLNKDINTSLKEGLIKATSEEDRIISDNNKKIREIKSERSKAKDKRVKNRIENETQGLVDENRDLHRLIRKNFKENNLPAYCDTKWFYALYCTQGGIEWLVKSLIFIVGLVIIPWIVVELADPWWFLKIILWAILMVVFIAVYMTIYLLTKDRDTGILEEMRENRYKISDNEKRIKKIRNSIKADTDESQYNLEEFDDEISALQSNIEQTAKTREEKLKDFEENKRQQIIDDVNKAHADTIEGIKKAIDDKLNEYKELSDKANELQKLVAENYEKYLTPQFTNKQCCEKMMTMIQNGQASNIGQALQMIKQ